MRGDRPEPILAAGRPRQFTPHARGSTVVPLPGIFEYAVYPACAGIDLEDVIDGGGGERLPRMRGDRPYWIFANR